MPARYDDLGPRIDIGQEPAETASAGGNPARPYAPAPSRRGLGPLGVISLLLSLLALALALWAMMRGPEPSTMPPPSPGVVPGATAERVAKLEKDAGDLMLRLVTLEKELEAVRAKAGSLQQLSKLSARVAALQDRLDSLSLDRRISSLQKKGPAPAAQAPAAQPPRPAAQEKPAAQKKPPAQEPPARKKQVYTVRRGDTLFTISLRYKVPVRDLKKWNDLKSDSIKVGQQLVMYK